MPPNPVLFYFHYPFLWIHHLQSAEAGAISLVSPDGCRIDVCRGASCFSFLESWCRTIGTGLLRYRTSHLWLTAKAKWLQDSRQEEEHRDDSLKWNRIKEGQHEDEGEGLDSAMTSCTRRQLDLFQLPFPPHEESCINYLSHTLLQNAASYKPAANFLPVSGFFGRAVIKEGLYVKEDDWKWFDLSPGFIPNTVWKHCHLMAV